MSSVRLFLAFILTLLLFAAAPHFSTKLAESRYYKASGHGIMIDHTSPGTVAVDPRIRVWVAVPSDSLQFQLWLHYRRSGQENFDSLILMRNLETLDQYETSLPRLDRGAVYDYFVELRAQQDALTLRLPQNPAQTVRVLFEGQPSLLLWATHVALMFVAAMFAFSALFNAFGLRSYERNLKRLSRKVLIAGALMLIGTVSVGALISHARFGYFWGGWPFGGNASQTLMMLLIFYFFFLAVIFRGTIFGFNPDKNLVGVPGAVILTLVGILFMIGVYLIGGHFIGIPL